MINDQLVGLPLSEVVKRLKDDIPLQVLHYMHSPDGFLDIFDNVLSQAARERFFVGGRLNLLDFASTHDPHAIQSLYGLLDKNDNLSNILDSTLTSDNGVNVKIGQEISKNKLLEDYSLITASYNVEQYGRGIIAVLGPTRMPYSRTIGIVNAFRQDKDDKYLRAEAEIQNMTNRFNKERAQILKYDGQDLAKSILPVLDNLKRALAIEVVDDNGKQLKKGIQMVHDHLVKALNDHGITEIKADGETFDPTLHQAVQTVPVEEGQKPETVVNVLQAGYQLKDRVLRPAMVVVAQ